MQKIPEMKGYKSEMKVPEIKIPEMKG